MRQKDQSDGGAREAKAERGQHGTPVEAVREPADWNLEREPTKHRHSMDIAIVARAMPSSCIQAGTSA